MASFTYKVLGMLMFICILITHPCIDCASGLDDGDQALSVKRDCDHDVSASGDDCICDSPCSGHPNLSCLTTTGDDRSCCYTPCESEIINGDEHYYCKAGNEERGDFTAGVRKVRCNPIRNTLNN